MTGGPAVDLGRRVAHGARRAAAVARDPRWGDVLGAIPRAAAFYARAWMRYASARRAGGAARAVPLVRPSPAFAAQAAVDELVLGIVRAVRRPRDAAVLARVEEEVEQAAVLARARGWTADPASYHAAPPALDDVRIDRARAGPVAFERLAFESGYEPHPGEPGRDRWLARAANRTAYAWVLRHPGPPRPWLVCLHGAGMGVPFLDLQAFRCVWLHQVLGLNVVLPVMALHGPRREGLPFGVGFPGDDLLDTVHAVSQTVWDTRRVVGWVRDQGADAVGLQGLSLGAHAAAVTAGLEDGLACVIAGVPAVDFADLFERHAPARFRGARGYERLHVLAGTAQHAVSPLAFAPRVPLERRYIFAGLADRLVHPRRQVAALWEHWGRPPIAWFEGSHVGFFFSQPVRRFVAEALTASGLAPPGGPPARSA